MQLSKMWKLCLVLLLGLALGVSAEDTTTDKFDDQEASATSEGGDSETALDALAGQPSAYLLALKELRSPGLFEGRQTLFYYTIFNVGQRFVFNYIFSNLFILFLNNVNIEFFCPF